MMKWEYKSESFRNDEHWDGGKVRNRMEDKMNQWGDAGWEIISVVCPQPSNYNTFIVTAKRRVGGRNEDGRKFR